MSCEICCDENNKIMINGDKLYQWDINRTVVIMNAKDVEQVHFSHCEDCGTALVVETYMDENENILADIPNSLLTSPRDICVWTWKDEHTMSGLYKLHVHARPRPDNYIYEPTKILTLESVVEWVKDFIEDYALQNATNYEVLTNKPSIRGVELIGNKELEDFDIGTISIDQIDELFSEE